MTFDWSTYLTLAGQLVVAGDEARCRSSVSRAYYSAFCCAREWLRTARPTVAIPRDSECHKFVQDWFNREPGRLNTRIASELKNLRISRTDADYENKLQGAPDKMAEAAVKRAQSVLDLLKQLLG